MVEQLESPIVDLRDTVMVAKWVSKLAHWQENEVVAKLVKYAVALMAKMMVELMECNSEMKKEDKVAELWDKI